MGKIGLVAAAALAVAFFATDGQAQKLPFGPEYEKAVCGCRATAKDSKRWPACMKRRGYQVIADPGVFVVCPGRKKK